MDAFRKQASKLREQVVKQQQAVIKQFSGSGYESSDVVVIDEVEMQRHQHMEKLYRATRAGRDFQKEIVKAAETFTAISYKHIETGTKLSEECCRYGAENNSDNILAKAASVYGDARKHVEKEHEELNRLLSSQKEEISRRQARVRESPTAEQVAKLHAAEAKMQELKANMAVLGKEASAALAAVDAQQQRLTFQRLVAMVESEKTFHLRVAAIFGEIETEIVSDRQKKESAPPVVMSQNGSEKTMYFLAEAMHPYDAETEKELSFSKGDFIVVRKVSQTGWSEGECNGKGGWFPSGYVEKRQRIPSSNMAGEVY
ncbi:clathrin-binding protein [Medicago truncatula]|uniref:Clathrin-binding protein n=1 Tax=Medicago truncatula TaxID=3880 RepID=A0A072TTE1_MEDTR|nr:clathrin-binding protein [Medicago truncatula]